MFTRRPFAIPTSVLVDITGRKRAMSVPLSALSLDDINEMLEEFTESVLSERDKQLNESGE